MGPVSWLVFCRSRVAPVVVPWGRVLGQFILVYMYIYVINWRCGSLGSVLDV